MVEHDDKYEDDEENLTQVRSIIKRLNEDKPSQERERQVVVRSDGSKVVRVTKKRRVVMTSADKRRKSRKQLLLGAGALCLALMLLVAFVAFRMATMSSSAYLESKSEELKQLWGASSLTIEGAGVEGTSLNLGNVTADFPDGNMLQHVELSGISAKLDMLSFITGKIKAENVNIERALIVLRNGASMELPRQQGLDIWQFRRMECNDFSVQFNDPASAPIQIKNTQAYLYYPKGGKSASIFMFRMGRLEIAGWKSVRIAEGKAHISASGVEDFSLRGTTDVETDTVEQRNSTVAIAGKMPQGSSLCGPFAIESNNMSLADFTDGRFEGIFTARTMAVSHGKLNGQFTMELAAGAYPRFQGEVHLRNICMSGFPALLSITEHIEPSKRRSYNPISMNRGYVRLADDGETRTMEITDGGLIERDLAMLRGKISINRSNELSGEMNYGIPLVLARMEYPDGQPDPMFRTEGDWAVLHTNLKGLGNMPADDMAEVEARASIARKERPARIPFDQLDVNRMTQELIQQTQPSLQTSPESVTPAQQEPVRQEEDTLPVAPSFMEPAPSNPFESAEDPFAPSTPF